MERRSMTLNHHRQTHNGKRRVTTAMFSKLDLDLFIADPVVVPTTRFAEVMTNVVIRF